MLRRLWPVSLALLAARAAPRPADADPRDPLEPMNRAVFVQRRLRRGVAKPVATRLPRRPARRDPRPRAQLLLQHRRPLDRRQQRAAGQVPRRLRGLGALRLQHAPSACSASTTSPPTWASRSTTRISARPSAAGASAPGPTWSCRSSARARCATPSARWLDLYADPLADVRPDRPAQLARRAAPRQHARRPARREPLLEQAALDRYVFQRDAYLQRRRSLIYDGSPPRERWTERQRTKPAKNPRPRTLTDDAHARNYERQAANHARSLSDPSFSSSACGRRRRAQAQELAPDVLVKNVTLEVVELIAEGQGDPLRQPRQADRRSSTPKVLPHFNFGSMTALAMGQNWNKATPGAEEAR